MTCYDSHLQVFTNLQDKGYDTLTKVEAGNEMEEMCFTVCGSKFSLGSKECYNIFEKVAYQLCC